MSTTDFYVVWFSPRGFANEGYYVYGHKDDCKKLLDQERDNINSGYTVMDKLPSLAKAEIKAKQRAINDRRGYGWQQQDVYIDHCPVRECLHKDDCNWE